MVSWFPERSPAGRREKRSVAREQSVGCQFGQIYQIEGTSLSVTNRIYTQCVTASKAEISLATKNGPRVEEKEE